MNIFNNLSQGQAHLSKMIHMNQKTKSILSYDVASGSEITPCNKIVKPLVVYRFRETL